VASIGGFDLGVVLDELDRFEDELRVYDEVIARFGDATEPALREQVAMAHQARAQRLSD
jgi:hypothetical protein